MLPHELTVRPGRTGDLDAVLAVLADQDLADVGELLIEGADIVADWQRPGYDVSRRSVGVWDGDRLVGYAELTDADRAEIAVHPSHRGRGIGTWLAHRLQEIARAHGSTVVGVPTPLGSPGDRLMAELGYRVRWTSWVLELPEGAAIPARELPEGSVVRAATEDDHRAAWTVIEDAFLEWSDRERQSFEAWQATVTRRPGFEPWQLRVVTDPGGKVVACAVLQMFGDDGRREGFVSRLATRRDQRHRGLAQALLVDSFAAARSHGAVRSTLSTDSRTGALGLYENVGMEVTSTWVNRAVDL